MIKLGVKDNRGQFNISYEQEEEFIIDMKFNIEIAKVLDKHLPANEQGTEREKLRTDLMTDLLMVVNKSYYKGYNDGANETLNDIVSNPHKLF